MPPTDGQAFEFQRPRPAFRPRLMLPGDDGLHPAACRATDGPDDLPVVMLTASGPKAVDRQSSGWNRAPTNYLAKPFCPGNSRRGSKRCPASAAAPCRPATPLADGEVISFRHATCPLESLRPHPGAGAERVGGDQPRRSFSLLAAFVQHPHRPLSRERLIERRPAAPRSETDSAAWMCRCPRGCAA